MKGDLPQTTEQLYGRLLHKYTIKDAIHDEAVLGFMIENLGPKDENIDASVYETEAHMRNVLEVVLNQSYYKFGMQNGRGRTYEAILTVGSIARAQKYYELLTKIKNGEDELKINEEIVKVVPDFPKFAITYSVSENDESSQVNQEKMQNSIDDYNKMFGTSYKIEGINAYNGNLNDRLARKEKKYLDRSQQVDIVIVVNRLLTGFDAPCLSTVYIDRPPMSPQDIIQTFSRTNRLFDTNKQFGQVVTFQAPKDYKKAINDALTLYSVGGGNTPVIEDWEEVLARFSISVKAIHALGRTAEEINALSPKQQKSFIHMFRALDHDYAHLKAFSNYTEDILDLYDFSQEEYETYYAIYKNLIDHPVDPGPDPEPGPVVDDYELIAYSKIRVDFEYIIELIQGVVESLDQSSDDFEDVEFEIRIARLREIIAEFAEDNPKLGELLNIVVDDIEKDKTKYIGQDVSVIINQMRYEAIDREVERFAEKWYLNPEDVRYEVYHFKDGVLANENNLKENADYTSYKENTPDAMPKFKFRNEMIKEFKYDLMVNILPLLE